jgi:hypothetical protein
LHPLWAESQGAHQSKTPFALALLFLPIFAFNSHGNP